MRNALILLCPLLGAGLIAGPALADYPERPVNFIVPYGAGGGTDTGVRTWQPYMEKCLGGTIVVINRPGAGAVIGMAELAAAAPDGYTLGGTNTPNVYTTDIAGDVPYTLDSYAFLGTLVGGRSTIVVREDSPIKSIADLIEHAKANNGEVKVGLSALGGDDHFMLQQLSQASGLKFTYIPMTDSPTVRTALMGGHIDITAMSHAEAASSKGEVRPISVANDERVDIWPDTATLREQGYDITQGSNHVISAPAGTPAEALDKWASCIETVAKDESFRADAQKRSVPLVVMNRAEVNDFIKKDEQILKALWESDPWVK